MKKHSTDLSSKMQMNFNSFKNSNWKKVITNSELIIEMTWNELLKNGSWIDVSWRESYVYSQIFLTFSELHQYLLSNNSSSLINVSTISTSSNNNLGLEKTLERLDMTLIFGAPPDLVNPLIALIEPIVKQSRLQKMNSNQSTSLIQYQVIF